MDREDWRPDADVVSPDGSVRLAVGRDGQLTVAVRGPLRSERSLERQIRAVARLALAALQRPAAERSPVPEPAAEEPTAAQHPEAWPPDRTRGFST